MIVLDLVDEDICDKGPVNPPGLFLWHWVMVGDQDKAVRLLEIKGQFSCPVPFQLVEPPWQVSAVLQALCGLKVRHPETEFLGAFGAQLSLSFLKVRADLLQSFGAKTDIHER